MRFNKFNNSPYTDALTQEAAGIKALNELITHLCLNLKTPHIYSVDNNNLILERINHQSGSNKQWQDLGQSMAQLHAYAHHSFGWNNNNYIGLNPQHNTLTDDWGKFFINYRLVFQINLIHDQAIQKQFKQTLASMAHALKKFLNQNCDFPSLLHGDLWSGNVLFDETQAWLIDPAVYYGDAEADIAMTELFGKFPAPFYRTYTEHKPLSEHYPIKRTVYNLYHQLNHYNIFGASYLPACKSAFNLMKNHFS